jgi:hypothetical protein
MTMSSRLPHRTGTTAPSARRFALLLCTALAAVALVLRLLDHVPGWLLGEPRTVQAFDSLDALESRLRVRLLLPAYFPDTLSWPPAHVQLGPGAGQPTAVTFLDRKRTRPRLIVCQTVRGEGEIPARLLPPLDPAWVKDVEIGDLPAGMTRGTLLDGTEWIDLGWRQSGRTIVVRFAGDERESLRIAGSLSRGHR